MTEMLYICVLSRIKFFEFMGTTGFDCKVNVNTSMSSNEIALVKLNFKFLNGEDNYALAA